MPSDAGRLTLHLVGPLGSDLQEDLAGLADLAPYVRPDDEAPLLADGREDPPLLGDRQALERVLRSGRQLAIVHPQEKHLAKLCAITGTGVTVPVDLISYGRVPKVKLRWSIPYHFQTVPRRKSQPEAVERAPRFGARDVVDALTRQRAHLDSGAAAPPVGMTPTNPDAIWFSYPSSSKLAFSRPWYTPVSGTEQTVDMSYDLQLYTYYVNGDPAASPYYLTVAMLFPTLATGGTSPQWHPAGFGKADTPYVIQDDRVRMANWFVSATNTAGSLSSFPISLQFKAPAGNVFQSSPPQQPGETLNVTVQLGNPGETGIDIPMYSDAEGVWTVPAWSASAEPVLMNITADMGMIDPGATDTVWSFPTEWLYTPSGANPGDVRAVTFATVANQTTAPALTTSPGSDLEPHWLENYAAFFVSGANGAAPPQFGPASLAGLSSQNRPTFYAVSVVGPKLTPNFPGGEWWANSQQYFPPPTATLRFNIGLQELLTSFTLYEFVFGYWTAPAYSDFPTTSASLNPLPGFQLSSDGEDSISVAVAENGSYTVDITVLGVGTFDGAVNMSNEWTTVPEGATAPTLTFNGLPVDVPIMLPVTITLDVQAAASTGQFYGLITATSPGVADQTLPIEVNVTASSTVRAAGDRR